MVPRFLNSILFLRLSSEGIRRGCLKNLNFKYFATCRLIVSSAFSPRTLAPFDHPVRARPAGHCTVSSRAFNSDIFPGRIATPAHTALIQNPPGRDPRSEFHKSRPIRVVYGVAFALVDRPLGPVAIPAPTLLAARYTPPTAPTSLTRDRRLGNADQSFLDRLDRQLRRLRLQSRALFRRSLFELRPNRNAHHHDFQRHGADCLHFVFLSRPRYRRC